jgi:hypothetical protein
MSDPVSAPAAPAAAPAAAPTQTPANGTPPAANRTLQIPGDSFHSFQAQLKERQQAQTPPKAPVSRETPPPRLATDPVPPESVQTMAQPGAPKQPPPVDPDGDLDDSVDPDAPPPQLEAQAQAALDQEHAAAFRRLKSGEMTPEELFELVKDQLVPMKNGDDVEYEKFGEAIENGMRRRDHTRNFVEWEKKEQSYQGQLQAYKTHFDQIGDPEKGGEAMYEVYSRQGWRKQMQQMAQKLAVEEQEDRDHAYGYAIAVMRRHGIQDQSHHMVQKAFDDALAERERIRIERDERRGVDYRNQQLEESQRQRVQQTEAAQGAERINRQLDQLRPRVFKQLGLLDNAKNDARFREHLTYQVRKTGAAKITPELCLAAAQELREEILDERKGRAPKAAAAPQPGFTGRLGASGGGKIAGNQPQPGLTVESMQARHPKLRTF